MAGNATPRDNRSAKPRHGAGKPSGIDPRGRSVRHLPPRGRQNAGRDRLNWGLWSPQWVVAAKAALQSPLRRRGFHRRTDQPRPQTGSKPTQDRARPESDL